MIRDIMSTEALFEVFKGERPGCHGSAHWFKVAQLGVLLAESSGGDPVVALLFGMYHDCRRENDGYDPDHGARARALILSHYNSSYLKISEKQLERVMYACDDHTKGYVSDCPTISSCWDADRLDLPRVDTQTEVAYLGTKAAKLLAMHQEDFYHGDW